MSSVYWWMMDLSLNLLSLTLRYKFRRKKLSRLVLETALKMALKTALKTASKTALATALTTALATALAIQVSCLPFPDLSYHLIQRVRVKRSQSNIQRHSEPNIIGARTWGLLK